MISERRCRDIVVAVYPTISSICQDEAFVRAGTCPKYFHCRRRSISICFLWFLLTSLRLEWSMSLSANPLDWSGAMNGLIVPDNMKTINKAVEMARSPDSILLKPGDHKIGDHKIKAGLFHNNDACYWEPEVEINKQLELHGMQGASLSGMLILQQPVDVETWRPVSGGGLVDGLMLSHKDPEGMHGYCVAVEGGRWVIEDCQVRCCGKYSKAVWVYGGEVSPAPRAPRCSHVRSLPASVSRHSQRLGSERRGRRARRAGGWRGAAVHLRRQLQGRRQDGGKARRGRRGAAAVHCGRRLRRDSRRPRRVGRHGLAALGPAGGGLPVRAQGPVSPLPPLPSPLPPPITITRITVLGYAGGRVRAGQRRRRRDADDAARRCRFEECEYMGVSACHGSQVRPPPPAPRARRQPALPARKP